jgi:hypothetical protein
LIRVEFIDELGGANVSALQTSVDELRRGDAAYPPGSMLACLIRIN